MISLAGRDILHSWQKFVLTGMGLGLLIGVTLTMAGVYRGMVDDGKVLLASRGDQEFAETFDGEGLPVARLGGAQERIVDTLIAKQPD